MKILDLGSHDGYISMWLVRQLQQAGVQVTQVDGVDFNEQAVKTAERRIFELGVPARFVVGDALNPGLHFEAGSYDAVIAFELLEHIPVPTDLLAACERMVKPDGRVYVSTPDGTFGTGHNPHHLHAIPAKDLADMLRRRGRLHNMDVASGVTVASYTPSERQGDVVVYCGPGWERWSPHDIATKGLGGSETAAVRVAEQLSKLGYVVTVYGDVDECCFRDVIFRDWRSFDPTVRCELFVSSRTPEIFDRQINARVRMLWFHDVDCGDRFRAGHAEQVDHVLALSHWHAHHLANRYTFARDLIRVTRNGIHHPYFEGDAPERRRRVVYTSSPDRGLAELLELWPVVREAVPDAELHHCYTAVYDKVAEKNPGIAANRKRIRELADQPGVVSVGHLSQPELATLMRSAMVWAHPSWHSPTGEVFNETSCIGAMEAMAAGCLVVAAAEGALRETVRVGRLVESRPLSDRWREVFPRMLIEGLSNQAVREWAQVEGPAAAAELGWSGVASQWVGLLDGLVESFSAPPEMAF